VVGSVTEAVTAEVTKVTMREYSEDEIARYVATGSPLDKSGAYAIQDAVFEAAHQGDTVAAGIMDYAARELASLVTRLLPHFGADERAPVDLATNGGLLYHDGPLHRMLRTKLSEEPRIRMREIPLDPASGAIHLAGKA